MNYRPDNRYSVGLGFSNVSRQQAAGYTPTRSRAKQIVDFKDDSLTGHHNIGELEQILERERIKFKDTKEKLEAEVDAERKKRIEFQNRLIKLKDELSRKDLQISQLQFRINNILHQNQDFTIENEKLRNQLDRLEDGYGGRIAQLQAELAEQRKQRDETTAYYHDEFEKFKKEGQEYVQSLNFQYERKIKTLQQKLKSSQANRKDLQFDNKRLNEQINSNKMQFQEEIRDTVNKIREDQQKKLQLANRSFEQKLKGLEDNKEVMSRKCQEYMRLLQQRDRQLEDITIGRNDQADKLRQQIGDLGAKIQQITFLNEKLKNQLHQRESAIGRMGSESNQQMSYLRQQFESKKKQAQSNSQAVRQLRQNLKDAQADFENKRKQLLERANHWQAQARKYKDECTRICQTLKSKVNETISNVGYKR